MSRTDPRLPRLVLVATRGLAPYSTRSARTAVQNQRLNLRSRTRLQVIETRPTQPALMVTLKVSAEAVLASGHWDAAAPMYWPGTEVRMPLSASP